MKSEPGPEQVVTLSKYNLNPSKPEDKRPFEPPPTQCTNVQHLCFRRAFATGSARVINMELHDRPVRHGSVGQPSEELTPDEIRGLAPADYTDPVIEIYKRDIDRTLLVENLRRTVSERLANFQSFMNELGELRGAALSSRTRNELVRNS